MAYTTKNAIEDFSDYLQINSMEKKVIPDTKDRGLVLTIGSDEQIVVFLYPLVHKKDNTKNYFDTRDSGAYERSVAWKYALSHDLKYFCIGINDQVDKFHDYLFSLECDETKIEKISGTKDGLRNGPGNQIIIPNDYVPREHFQRIKNRLGIYIAAIHKNSAINYFKTYDNRPYMGIKQEISEENEYILAANKVKQYIEDNALVYEATSEEVQQTLDDFKARFAPEKLKLLTSENILSTLFYTANNENDSLCYFLEFNSNCKNYFGSISGGSSYKFGLFQKKDTGQWMTGSAQRPQIITEEEAIVLGTKIRDYLVNGAEIIKNASLNTVADYEGLEEELEKVTEGYCNLAWIHKYFCMILPEKFSVWHSQAWQKHYLYALKIKPSEKYYGKCGQLSIIKNYAGISNQLFGLAVYEMFGNIKHFMRIGTTDSNGQKKYADELIKEKSIGIGWTDIGDLRDFLVGNSLQRDAIKEQLKEVYYTKDTQSGSATRKVGELINFYESNTDTIFVAMDGEKILGLIDHVGEYYYEPSKTLGHRKVGMWHRCFEKNQKMPYPSEAHLTSCFEVSNSDNLMFLYNKYYYELEDVEGENNMVESEFIPLKYNTSLNTDYEWNRIVFGAPGTGKSYRLKQDANALMTKCNGTMERVTFHPEYTYSQFVGTYKPVTNDSNEILYDFVPGPFIRVYVEALRSARTENPQAHLLLIEEINRAKVAAVFGDVFQLLDRDDQGVSEYDIVASEDIRKYLARELGGQVENYKKIQIPNNMFIWATMNSADQGVYPMDTAFKRRWNFEYIGIDENESELKGHIILGSEDDEMDVEWNTLRKAINQKLSQDFKVNEDKLLGPFFISRNILKTDSNNDDKILDSAKFIEAFKSKVIMYLYEDAAKQFKHKLFAGCDNNRYSLVCEAFDKKGIKIFGEDFIEDFYHAQEG